MLAAEDVELRVSPGIGDACTTIGTTGEAHLERVVDRLKREFAVEAAVGKPTVAYRTVTGSSPGRFIIMEPVMQVIVRTDSRHVGVVLEWLRLRRGEVQPPARDTSPDVVTARVPLSELFGFETHLRVLTHGQASCSVDFAGYQPLAPGAHGDDENSLHVGVPRRPAPTPRITATSVPGPDDDSEVPD